MKHFEILSLMQPLQMLRTLPVHNLEIKGIGRQKNLLAG
jgi:hypothetical protein